MADCWIPCMCVRAWWSHRLPLQKSQKGGQSQSELFIHGSNPQLNCYLLQRLHCSQTDVPGPDSQVSWTWWPGVHLVNVPIVWKHVWWCLWGKSNWKQQPSESFSSGDSLIKTCFDLFTAHQVFFFPFKFQTKQTLSSEMQNEVSSAALETRDEY